MKKVGEAIGRFVTKHKNLIVIVSLVLLIPSAFGYFGTKVNYDLLYYMPSDIETMKGQDILADDFGMSDFAMCAIDHMDAKDILDLEKRIKKIDGVTDVISANDILGTTIPIEMLPDNVTSKVVKGDTQLMLITFTTSDKAIDALKEIRTMVDERVKISGMSSSLLDTSIIAQSEIITYVLVAVALVLIVLMLSLDSFVIPFLLLGNIGMAIVYNMGSNYFLGQISYITQAIAAVLQLGVTTDFSIFLYHKYERMKKTAKNKEEAMIEAVGETLVAVAGSALTTVAGFLALCTMQLTLGTDIGVVMAKGVIFGIISTITIFPALLLVFDKSIEKTQHKVMVPRFVFLRKCVLRCYPVILAVAVLLAYPAYKGYSNLEQYYDLKKDLPDTLESVKAGKEVADKFDLVSANVVLVNRDIKDNELNKMVEELEDVKGVTMVLSPSKLSGLNIPEEMLSEKVTNIYQSDKYQMVYINSEYDTATDELNNSIDQMKKIVKKYDKTAILAGEGPCMKDMVDVAAEDFANVNTASILVIFVIMLFVLKSASLPILLVAGIELAVFINMACAYYMGTVEPFVAGIVIGTIQLGATIDYAILLTTKYLEERKSGVEKKQAVGTAIDTSVGSIFVSGMSFFAATFGVGMVSKLDMIGSLCTLMSRGAIVSMITVAFVIPSLLLVFDKLIVKTSIGFKGLKGEQ